MASGKNVKLELQAFVKIKASSEMAVPHLGQIWPAKVFCRSRNPRSPNQFMQLQAILYQLLHYLLHNMPESLIEIDWAHPLLTPQTPTLSPVSITYLI